MGKRSLDFMELLKIAWKREVLEHLKGNWSKTCLSYSARILAGILILSV